MGRVTVDSGATLDATSWNYGTGGGDPTNGLGEIRFITTGHGQGEIVKGLQLMTNSSRTVVMPNTEREMVFIPVFKEDVWTGIASSNSGKNPPTWQDVYSSDSNWREVGTVTTGHFFPGGSPSFYACS